MIGTWQRKRRSFQLRLSYLVVTYFYNVPLSRTLYPKLSVQLFAYRRFLRTPRDTNYSRTGRV